ncbi:MAG: hypothetical protein KAZ70_01805 [Actinomyces sp.]|nr:hypothetical protein [Actinomyces sp.]
MTSLYVVAHLAEKTSGIVGRPFMLDGPLAWAEATLGDYPPLTRNHAPEIPLPLEKWEEDREWGWKCSQADYEVAASSVLEIRRKPSDAEFARFTKERKHHHGLGPHKARDLVIPTAHIPKIAWNLECTDQAWLDRLLRAITHLGSHRAIGLGKVSAWTITPGKKDAWRNRPFAAPCRPPYWHQARQR